MEHAPIYRSTKRRTRAAPIQWRRTASLASAVIGVAFSGIALGSHGFWYATDRPEAETSVSGSPDLPFPGFSVQAQGRGHPDAIGALSSALLARIPVGQAVVESLGQPLGPLPFPVQQPTAQPATSFTDLELPFLGPAEVISDPAAEPIVAAPADSVAAVEDVSAEPLAAAQAEPAAPLVIARAGQAAFAAPEQTVAADSAADEVAAQVADPPPAGVVVAEPTPASTAHPAQSSAATVAAPTRAPTPRPTPEPVTVRKVIVPVEKEPAPKQNTGRVQSKEPQARPAAPEPAAHVAPPKQSVAKPNDNKAGKSDSKSKDSGSKHGD